MANYKKIDDDIVQVVTQRSELLPLKVMAERLQTCKEMIEAWPVKDKPDEQTLQVYNEQARMMRDPEIDQARELLRRFKEIYDAGQLPDRWVKPLHEFANWLKQFD
jgi:hypothetical protein